MKILLLLLVQGLAWGADPGVELKLVRQFVLEVYVRVQTEAVTNERYNRKVLSCIPEDGTPQCRMLHKEFLSLIPQAMSEARMHLALGFRDQILPQNAFTVNATLRPLGTYKETPWLPLSPAELAAATQVLSRYREEAEEAASMRWHSSDSRHAKFVRLTVEQKRRSHLELYEGTISHIGIIQYLRGDEATVPKIRTAFAKMHRRSQEELRGLTALAPLAETWDSAYDRCVDDIRMQLDFPNASGGLPNFNCAITPPKLAALLDYKSIAQGIVEMNPQFAQTATALSNERSIREMAGLLAIMPLMAASILAPPLVAVPLSLVGGIGSCVLVERDYRKLKSRELSAAVTLDGVIDWPALREARYSRNLSFVLLPLLTASPAALKFTKQSRLIQRMSKSAWAVRAGLLPH